VWVGVPDVGAKTPSGGLRGEVALARNAVWVAGTSTNTLMAPVAVPGTPRALVVGFGSVWVGDPALSAVLELAPS
jgi:hypothetical protein